jgi:hypothetical protein
VVLVNFMVAVPFSTGSSSFDPTGTKRHSGGSRQDPSWSPEGKHIAYRSERDDGTPEIWVMDADGTSQRRLTEGLLAVVIFGSAVGIAAAYPSHAYRTAATNGELATIHTYRETVGSFEGVSQPLQVERFWSVRIGVVLGAGVVLALGLLLAAKRENTRARKVTSIEPSPDIPRPNLY